MSTSSVTVDRLQKLFSGEPVPQLPDWNNQWKLPDFRLELEAFHRRLLEYIRRLMSHMTEANLIDHVSGVGLGDWRYHAASHTFQLKRFDMDGKLGDWEDAPPDQPVTVTDLVDVQYNSTSHTLQKKTQATYVLEAAVTSAWTTWFTATSTTNLTDWHYNATTHKFQYKTQTDYIFQANAASAYTDAPNDQPVARTNLVEWHYDATTHKFQYKTQAGYTLEVASASAYTNAPADQPVSIVRVDRQITYDTGAEQLLEDYVVDVYVLEKGANTDDNLVAQAEECVT